MKPSPKTYPNLQVLLLIVLTACSTLSVVTLVWMVAKQPNFSNDFMGIWSFARYVTSQPAAGIYDGDRIGLFQRQLFPGLQGMYAFAYPPPFLLAISWLAKFNYISARLIWSGSSMVLLCLVLWRLLTPNDRWFGVLASLVAPASYINAIGGETGWFTAAFLLAGFTLLSKRPRLAGIAFGLLSLKPQLALLVPFALLGGGFYRTLLSAAVTVFVLYTTSYLALPHDVWAAWLGHIVSFQSQELSKSLSLTSIMVTVTANLLSLGLPPFLVTAVQGMTSLICAILTYLSFRKGNIRLAAAALLVGSFLATPHSFVYDTIPLTAAMFIYSEVACITWQILLIGLVVYLSPFIVLTQANHLFLYAIPEGLLYFFILRLAFATPAREDLLYEKN